MTIVFKLARLAFWGSLGFFTWVYLVFPLLVVCRGILSPRPIRTGAGTPWLSIIVAAFNEEAVIQRKLDNLMEQDYPHDRLEIIVASDGSDDATNEIVRTYPAPQVRLLPLPRQGKNLTLNSAILEARSDILVFTDADIELKHDALRQLVAPFADPTVGGVGSDLPVRSGTGRTPLLNRLRRKLKALEARSGTLTNLEGSLYAMRRACLRPLPTTVADDFFIALQVPLGHMRLVFEPRAIAYDARREPGGSVFDRHVRIYTGALFTVWYLRQILLPWRYGFFSLQLVSHKVLRRLTAVPLLLLAISSLTLASQGWPYRTAVLGQLLFYGAGLLGMQKSVRRALPLPGLKFAHNYQRDSIAGLVAAINLARGAHYHCWNPGGGRSVPQANEEVTSVIGGAR